MEVKQVQIVQANHAERLIRLERRQTEDAAIKSVWNPSPFPSVLGGTPQHGKLDVETKIHAHNVLIGLPGPVQLPNNQVFDDFDDEQGQNLLGSLHLDADEEPTRRGAASRANSVRFDETTLHGSSWGQSGRQSGEFGPTRPSSGLGGPSLMERSYSHKSDGRHSSAGHSVHSFHSVASGRTSSLGLDLLLGTRDDDDDSSPIDIAGPPPGLMFLGSFPSIVRCWLTTQYSHDTLLYAVVCSGSQKSTVDYLLLKELDLLREAHRNMHGILRITIPVYFAEATVSQSHSRSSSSSQQVPYINVDFEVTGAEQAEGTETRKEIRIFIGSDTLRANSADLLLSQNRMSLFGNGDDRDRLSVPFVRPEDESTYKHITTVNVLPEKPKLNATAPEFVSVDLRTQTATVPEPAEASVPQSETGTSEAPSPFSPMMTQSGYQIKSLSASLPSDSGSDRQHKEPASNVIDNVGKENLGQAGEKRRDSVGGIWGSWRQGTAPGSDSGQRENGLSGYQPAGSRGGRSMKILKPQKSISLSSSARAAPAYDPAGPSRTSGETRRKSQGAVSSLEPVNGGSPAPLPTVRWENVRRSVSSAASVSTAPPPVTTPTTDTKPKAAVTRSNPIGGATAFSWMTPGAGNGAKPLDPSAGKPKAPTAAV